MTKETALHKAWGEALLTQKEAVIIDGVRSPVGKHNGALSAVRPDDLLADILRALVRDVHAGLRHHAHRRRVDRVRLYARRPRLDDVGLDRPGPPLGHLAAAGVAGAEEEDSELGVSSGLGWLSRHRLLTGVGRDESADGQLYRQGRRASVSLAPTAPNKPDKRDACPTEASDQSAPSAFRTQRIPYIS